MKRFILVMLLFSATAFAQFVPPPSGAYISSSGVFGPATSTQTLNALSFVPPPAALYCFNTSTGKWVPADSSCFGGGGGAPTTCVAGTYACLAVAQTFTAEQTISPSTGNTALVLSTTDNSGSFFFLQGTGTNVTPWFFGSAGQSLITGGNALVIGSSSSGIFSHAITLASDGSGITKTTSLMVNCWASTNSVTTSNCTLGLSQDGGVAGQLDIGTGAQSSKAATIAAAGAVLGGNQVPTVPGTPTPSQAVCLLAAGPPPTLGKCTSVVGAGGACTCAGF